MYKAAEISPCGDYRYWLLRVWDRSLRTLPIVMLNPSTADASKDDPTIRRCISFAKREGFGGIRVVNLFAYRATSPDDMKAAADPYGPEGNAVLGEIFMVAGMTDTPVLAAWGANGDHLRRAERIKLSAKHWGARLVCFGTTKDGHPRHPLYVAGDQPLVPFG